LLNNPVVTIINTYNTTGASLTYALKVTGANASNNYSEATSYASYIQGGNATWFGAYTATTYGQYIQGGNASGSDASAYGLYIVPGSPSSLGKVYAAYFGGNVGIGTSTPSKLLTVQAYNATGILALSGYASANTAIGLGRTASEAEWGVAGTAGSYSSLSVAGDVILRSNTKNLILTAKNATGGIRFSTGATDVERMVITSAGNVGIGSSAPQAKLDVAGGIRADSIVINNGGADFIFEDDYNLISLEEIEQFIKENKHLPDIPAAKQMQKEGVSVGTLQVKLLQKVEELTLYLIEQNKRIQKLEKENKELKRR
jgi:hypothetical protein